MGYYSDPTASRALGQINREFSKLEKRAKQLHRLYREGKLSDTDLIKAQAHFTGLYRHLLERELAKD